MSGERVTRFAGDGRLIEVFPVPGSYMALVTCGDWQRGQSGFRDSKAALAWAEQQQPSREARR